MAEALTGALVRGVVLRLATYGESDRMASVLCADGSRRELRVPQARRSRKRFGGFDLFVLADLSFEPDRKGRPRLQSVEIVSSHGGIRDDVVRTALAAHVAELVHQAAQEDHGAPELFRLTTVALSTLSAGAADAHPAGWARGFELKLLHVLGVRPSLVRCAVTGQPIEGQEARWSTPQGGVLGPDAPTSPRALSIRTDALFALDAALHTPLAEQSQVRWPRGSGPGAENVLRDFLAVNVGRRDRARQFLHGILGGLAALLVATVLTGCGGYVPPETVRVQGWLYESPEPTTDTAVISAATASAWDPAGEGSVEGAEPFSDAPGWYRFSGLAPESYHHHVFAPPAGEADHPDELGHVTTVIPGTSAVDDLYVDAGTFHLWPRPIVDGWRTAWSLVGIESSTLDPGTDDDGGLVRGRAADPEGAVGLVLWIEAADGTSWPARYTDALGAPSPQASGLSEDGGFFFEQLPAGHYQLEAGRADGTPLGGSLSLRVEEDGVTSLPWLVLSP